MKTKELIKQLKKLDPKGDMPVDVYYQVNKTTSSDSDIFSVFSNGDHIELSTENTYKGDKLKFEKVELGQYVCTVEHGMFGFHIEKLAPKVWQILYCHGEDTCEY